MDLYLTRLPLLGRLILRTSSSDSLGGLPILRPAGLVGFQFPALVVLGVFLAAVGTFRSRLARCLGCVGGGRRCRYVIGREELLKHRHHVLHLFSVLCLEYVATSAMTMA